MKKLKNVIGLLVFCLLAAPLAAQEKIGAISPKSKEAKEKLKNASATIGQTLGESLQDLGKAVGSKLGLATQETKPVTAAGSVRPSLSDQKTVEVPQARMPLAGRRDPFLPFTLNTPSAPARNRDHLSPLERLELGQLKLVGVVQNARNSNALIEDAAGLGYVVKLGTPIGSNDGRVIAIKRDGILIEERFVDLYGVQKKREVSMKLSAENVE
jgi:Tfp pilus assembly protein PilP